MDSVDSKKEVREREAVRRSEIDAHVGKRIRLRRTGIGMTALALGEVIGVRYQQINFYETGHNKISAGNLYLVAEALDVPISFFFDDLPEHTNMIEGVRVKTSSDAAETLNIFSALDIKTVESEIRIFAEVYYSVERTDIRKGIVEFMKILAKAQQPLQENTGTDGVD